jgi:hypothetical protein
MAEGVVDLLEPVQVDEQQDGPGLIEPVAVGIGGRGDVLVQQDAVRQTGQGVVPCLVPQVVLERPLLG